MKKIRACEATIFYVYGLIDPFTQELRYIGYTYDLKERFSDHCTNLRKKNHKVNWIKSLKKIGCRPKMIIIEEHTSIKNAKEAEIDLIAYFRYIGCNLTNGTDGGEGCIGRKQPFEIRKQISETLIKIKNENKLIIEKEEITVRDNTPKTNKKLTEKHKQKISVAHKGKSGLKGKDNPIFGKKRSIENIINASQGFAKNNPDKVKLSFEKAEEIRKLYNSKLYVIEDLANMYNVCNSTISKILNNKRYKKEHYK